MLDIWEILLQSIVLFKKNVFHLSQVKIYFQLVTFVTFINLPKKVCIHQIVINNTKVVILQSQLYINNCFLKLASTCWFFINAKLAIIIYCHVWMSLFPFFGKVEVSCLFHFWDLKFCHVNFIWKYTFSYSW